MAYFMTHDESQSIRGHLGVTGESPENSDDPFRVHLDRVGINRGAAPVSLQGKIATELEDRVTIELFDLIQDSIESLLSHTVRSFFDELDGVFAPWNDRSLSKRGCKQATQK
jgi:hypothetical protein